MKDSHSSQAQLRDMTGCVGFALRRTTRAVTQLYDATLRPHRLRVTQLPILVAASQPEAIPLGPLAERLGMERTTLLRNIRPLVRRRLLGLVTDDAGRTRIRTTAAGRALLARAYPAWKQVQTRVLANLRGKDWPGTLQALGGVARGARE
jgi:DNA-binding MarR family transcriptional regulator